MHPNTACSSAHHMQQYTQYAPDLRKFVTELKTNKAVGNDGIPSEVYKFASVWLLMMMSIFLYGFMLIGKLPSNLMHVVIIPQLKCKTKDTPNVKTYWPIAIATALSKILEQVFLLQLIRYLWTADSQFGCKQAHGTKMAIFALEQTVDFYCNTWVLFTEYLGIYWVPIFYWVPG